MKYFKLFVASLLIISGFVFFNASFAQAVSYPRIWTLSVSDLAATTTTKTYNIDYATMSTYLDDSFVVDLYQNGSKVQSQTTPVTGKAGNTGTFSVTVANNGAYSYVVTATNTADATQQSASTSTTVNNVAPVVTTTTVITTIPTTTTPAAAAITATATTPAGEVAGAGATATTKTGEVAGVTATSKEATKTVTKVAGTSTKILGMSPTVALGVLAATLVTVGVVWYIIGRRVDNSQ